MVNAQDRLRRAFRDKTMTHGLPYILAASEGLDINELVRWTAARGFDRCHYQTEEQALADLRAMKEHGILSDISVYSWNMWGETSDPYPLLKKHGLELDIRSPTLLD